MLWYLYIVEAKDKSLYTGITTNINRRIQEHNNGKGAKYLSGRRPVSLIYSEKLNNQSEALKRENEIKGWNKKKKLLLVKSQILQGH
ncbi:MAG: GIY-YIG nuclease family protein [bacterium]|nr:GIY-YIG nuclease family protein [bacterium]